MGNPKLVKHFFTKVVGVGHRNANGTTHAAPKPGRVRRPARPGARCR
jgi:hypothetical protein